MVIRVAYLLTCYSQQKNTDFIFSYTLLNKSPDSPPNYAWNWR